MSPAPSDLTDIDLTDADAYVESVPHDWFTRLRAEGYDVVGIDEVQFFDASFAEGSNEDQQKITRPAGDSFARYGHNLLPVDEKRLKDMLAQLNLADKADRKPHMLSQGEAQRVAPFGRRMRNSVSKSSVVLMIRFKSCTRSRSPRAPATPSGPTSTRRSRS